MFQHSSNVTVLALIQHDLEPTVALTGAQDTSAAHAEKIFLFGSDSARE
jgi:hypothetical protein